MPSSPARLLIAALFAGVLAPAAVWGQSGDLSLGASYSSLYGPTANIAFSAEGLGRKKDIAASVRFRGGPEGEEGRVSFLRSPEVETGKLRYAFTANAQNWDHIPYESRGVRVSVEREKPVGPRTSFGAGAFAGYDDVTAVVSGMSGILARDFGESSSIGVNVFSRFESGDFEPGQPDAARLRLDSNLQIAGLGDRKYVALELGARYEMPLSSGFVLKTRLKAGAIRGLDDDYVSVLDRAFQGDLEPRGFEYGGLGPRDPATQDALGGANFYAGSVEIQRPVAETPVVIGAFVDFGSTWSVPGVSDPMLYDQHEIRASAGVSVEFSSDFGSLRVSYAEPFERQDHDRVQRLSVALVASF
ncbi:BamA/TamA family outer membrane protein [Maricaulis sp.]|uniref:BamA/TamA family outer membrane protein n=1 Tax=Maricaulis sp. TaxID=1486257 RepID=UPI00260A878E|nr:BamA/TamA family outer membrane protein [Maricaulis sp.]